MRQTQPTKEYRWLAAFTLFFLGSAMVFSFARFPVLLRSKDTRESLNLAKRALSYSRATMDNLYARTLDIVNWDESYHFMLERQAGFIEKNFTPTFFKALDIDTVLFLNPDGSVTTELRMISVKTNLRPSMKSLPHFLFHTPPC